MLAMPQLLQIHAGNPPTKITFYSFSNCQDSSKLQTQTEALKRSHQRSTGDMTNSFYCLSCEYVEIILEICSVFLNTAITFSSIDLLSLLCMCFLYRHVVCVASSLLPYKVTAHLVCTGALN